MKEFLLPAGMGWTIFFANVCCILFCSSAEAQGLSFLRPSAIPMDSAIAAEFGKIKQSTTLSDAILVDVEMDSLDQPNMVVELGDGRVLHVERTSFETVGVNHKIWVGIARPGDGKMSITILNGIMIGSIKFPFEMFLFSPFENSNRYFLSKSLPVSLPPDLPTGPLRAPDTGLLSDNLYYDSAAFASD